MKVERGKLKIHIVNPNTTTTIFSLKRDTTNSADKIKYNNRKYTQARAIQNKAREKNWTKNRWDKWKTPSKITDLNKTIAIITLNVNGLYSNTF